MVRLGCVLLVLLAPAQDAAVRDEVARLRSDRPLERAAAERSLRAIGAAALPALREAAADADLDFSRRAAKLARAIEAVRLLGPRVLEKIPGADDLIASRHDRAWTSLFLQAHAMPGITVAALEVLAPRALAGAAPAEPDAADERRTVARIIAERGLRSAIPGLMSMLASPDASAREPAALALGHLRAAESMPAIRRLLQDENGRCRAAAATALGALGALETVPDLALAVTDSSYEVSTRAREALQHLSRPVAIAELVRLLDRKSLPFRCHAAVALDLLRHPDRERVTSVLFDDEMADVEGPVIDVLTDLDRPDAVPRLVALLRDPRAVVRRGALEVLDRMGARNVGNDLVPLLRDPDKGIRYRAVRLIGALVVPAAADPLLELLRDPDETIQSQAASALGRLKWAAARPQLLTLLREGCPEVRKHVAWSLGDLVRPEDAPVLLEALEDPEQEVREQAVRHLWKAAPVSSLPVLARAIGTKPIDYWNPDAFEAPQRAGVVAGLRKLLVDPETPVRSGALWLASKCGLQETAPEIARLSDDPDPELRTEAVTALAGFLGRKSIGTLVSKIADDHGPMRSLVCGKLAEFDEGDRAVPALLQSLRDRGYERAVVEALENFCAREAVPVLIPLLKQNAPVIRLHALAALVRLQSPPPMDAIRQLLEDVDEGVRHRTIEVVASLKIREAVPELRAALRSGEAELRIAAVDALGKLSAGEAAADLLPLLEDPADDLRASAARAIGRMEERRAIPALRALLADHDGHVRQNAAEALGELGATESVPDLLRLLRSDLETGWNSWGCAGALGALQARESVPDLVRLLQQEILGRRRPTESLRALRRLDPEAAGRAVLQLLEREESVPRRFTTALDLLRHPQYREFRRGCHYEPPPPARALACEALAELGRVDAIPALRRLFDARDEEVRQAAVHAFLKLAGPAMAGEMAGLLKDPSSEIRAAALHRLAALDRRESLAAGQELLRDSSSDVRSAAVAACARLGGGDAIPVLRPLLGDADRWIRMAAASALCRLGERAGMPVLLEEGTSLASLNAIRDPETWKRLKETPFRNPGEATVRELLSEVVRQSGLALEIPRILPTAISSELAERRTLEGSTLLDAVDQLLPRYGAYGLIFGEGRLRVVRPGEERKFWETWSEQAKR